ncbi:hypothetical protein EJ04DRAFT_560586 [Polyplosphaeria fusca]|uniref:Zn(2)-C6 fungal-type domain-containing protein n=1 Tax=Polyplosphaeria fusca TaxID=682080 RepID=A0A9P4R7N5_9PLEO|nr:hypothetical protein EJ04DRAFT_560586 [Polyplosphaeria fusca]
MLHSPSPEIKVKKRKRRAVLSCNDCRRRKLKCDRELPCNRCIQGGNGSTCAYGHELSDGRQPIEEVRETVSHPGHSSITDEIPPTNQYAGDTNSLKPIHSEYEAQDQVQQLQGRIASLEACLSSLSTFVAKRTTLDSTQVNDLAEGEPNPGLASLFKGRDYRTFVYGPTSPITIVVNFPEIRLYMKRAYPDSTLERLSSDIKALESRARSSGPSRVLSVSSLRSLLLDRPTVDLLVQRYLETFETTYRIIHVPTFLEEYEAFWHTTAETNSDLEAVLVAILACVLCTSNHENTKYYPNGSTFRSKAIIWVKACEAWLKRQSNKHRTLATLQVRCLRLLALKTTCLKTKEYYQEVQTHLGFMKGIGMHRDPAFIEARCSLFEGELRRRLWATSVELEIQASIDRGITSSLIGLECDCAAPRNINDSELAPGIQELPLSHPTSEFTDCSFVYHAVRTAALRIKLCGITNSIRTSPEFDEVLKHEQEVQEALNELPSWPDPKALHAGTHLDLNLRQFLVILHTPRAFKPSLRSHPNSRYSILTCLEQSTALIQRHTRLLDAKNFALCCIRSDYFRAALIICRIAYDAAKLPDPFLIRLIQSLFDPTISSALRLLEERSMRPGRGNHQFWYISAGCSLVRTQFEPAKADVYRRQACDRVARLLHRILALQDEEGGENLANEVVLGNEATFTASGGGAAAAAGTGSAFGDAGMRMEGFDLGHGSEWMLDDFWFLNDFPPLDFAT